jgi:uncharacterized protein (DUF1330 family)
MQYENKVYPSPEQFKALLEQEEDGPICMVNLLKFKSSASYDDGRETTLSGEEAYHLYGSSMAEFVESKGGKIIYSSTVAGLILGEVEELWDAVAIAEYPSRQGFIDIATSAEVAEIAVHRSAGLAGQLNIVTKQDSMR